MPTKFDWQTPEEDEWEVGNTSEAQGRQGRNFKATWFGLVIGLFLLGGVVYWQFNERIALNEAAREADIVAAYELLRRAVDTEDDELYTSLLSRSDRKWREALEETFRNGWTIDRTMFGFKPLEQEYSVEQVLVSPDFKSAEITVEESFYTNIDQGTEQIVNLQQSYLFRWDKGWRLVKTGNDYWGENREISYQEAELTINYPARDQVLVERLAEDLGKFLHSLCDDDNQNFCPTGLATRLNLSEDYGDFLRFAASFFEEGYAKADFDSVSDEYELTLPAPSIVGNPIDEAGYQALMRNYAAHIAYALLDRSVADECCESDAHLQALLQSTFSRLDLVDQLVPSGEAASSQVPVEEVALEVMCSDGNDRGVKHYLYTPMDGAWEVVDYHPNYDRAITAPNGRGFVIKESIAVSGGKQITLTWHHGAKETMLYDDVLPPRFAGRFSWSISKRDAMVIVRVPSANLGLGTFFSYDFNSCTETDCQPSINDLQGYPVWSPDGRFLIVRGFRMLWEISGDEYRAVTQLGEGRAPFWIDDTTYGFVRDSGSSQWQVIKAVVGGDKQSVLFNYSDLLFEIPGEDLPTRLDLALILPAGETGSRWWLVAIGTSYRDSQEKVYIFEYNSDQNSFELIADREELDAINLSADGTKLAGRIYDKLEHSWRYEIYVLGEGHVWTYDLGSAGIETYLPSSDWSPDEDWFLAIEQGLMRFYNLERDEKFIVEPPQSGCFRVAWVEIDE